MRRDFPTAGWLNPKLLLSVSPLWPELRGAVEEVLPTLKEQGIRVFIMSERCDVEGIQSLSDKIQQASDEPLSKELRANIHLKSPALYIYTSGTTGELAFNPGVPSCVRQTLSEALRTIKHSSRLTQLWLYLSGLPKAAIINHQRLWMATFLQSIAGVRSDDIIYIYLPLYHSAGFLMGLCGAIEKGDSRCNKTITH